MKTAATRRQDIVAGLVAVHVVDALEVIDVEQHQADVIAAARGPLELLPERRVERAAVGQPGQAVGRGAPMRVLEQPRVAQRQRRRAR